MEILERKFDEINVKRSYKKVAWFYNFWSWFTERKALEIVIGLTGLTGNDTVLEVACGTGLAFEEIVKRNPSGLNIGIDLSPDMLAKAEKRLRTVQNARYELKEGDIFHLNLNDNFFDIVVNNFMVDLLPVESFNNIAEEFYRVLKPGGIIVISTFSFGTKNVNKFWFWIAKKFPGLLTGCRPVSFKEYLIKAGFVIEKELEITQNTFPSQIIKAQKH